MNKLQYIEFTRDLDLDWEERFSMDYSSGLFSYWEIYEQYRQRKAMETLKSWQTQNQPVIGEFS